MECHGRASQRLCNGLVVTVKRIDDDRFTVEPTSKRPNGAGRSTLETTYTRADSSVPETIV